MIVEAAVEPAGPVVPADLIRDIISLIIPVRAVLTRTIVRITRRTTRNTRKVKRNRINNLKSSLGYYLYVEKGVLKVEHTLRHLLFISI
jgi:hypothetical protein